jgi:hypothetical protein
MSAYTLHFKCDAPLQIDPPQSSYSNRGESSRVDWLSSGGSVDGTLSLPGKLLFATQFSARTGHPYNITTGTDANGDGTFTIGLRMQPFLALASTTLRSACSPQIR